MLHYPKDILYPQCTTDFVFLSLIQATSPLLQLSIDTNLPNSCLLLKLQITDSKKKGHKLQKEGENADPALSILS